MSSTVSSVFSTDTTSEHRQQTQNLRIDNFLSAPATLTRKNAPIFSSALNVCYQNALLSLKDHVEELVENAVTLNGSNEISQQRNPSEITDDDFEATIVPNRTYSPSQMTISEWRHDAFLTDRFVSLMQKLVAQEIYSIVFDSVEFELNHEEEGERRKRLEKKRYQLQEMEKSIRLEKLYELSEISQDILFDQVDWKLINTQMRKEGGFKYFDEYILKRFWIYRCQFAAKVTWSIAEDQRLDQLVNELGYGRWSDIAQDDLFQVRFDCDEPFNRRRCSTLISFRKIKNQLLCVHNDICLV